MYTCMLYTLVCFCRNAFCGQLQCREGQLMTSPGISALFTLNLFGGGSVVCQCVHVCVCLHKCMHVDTCIHFSVRTCTCTFTLFYIFYMSRIIHTCMAYIHVHAC